MKTLHRIHDRRTRGGLTKPSSGIDFYKRILPSRRFRQQVLHVLDWVPDRRMVSLQYRIKRGFWPDLNHPKRLTEKLNWYKLYWRDPLMSDCVDKAKVRDYVELMGYGNILTPLVGVFDSPDEIDYCSLPRAFVLKDSFGSGNNDVIVCRDKSLLDWDDTVNNMRRWVRPGAHRKNPGREWVYDRFGSSRIVIEELLVPDNDQFGIIDYKFFCFNGEKPKYMYVVCDRKPGSGGQFGIFEVDGFRDTGVQRVDERPLTWDIPRPVHLHEMAEIATELASPFPHARIDLYDLGNDGGVRFGEITFFDGSGYFQFNPDEFDFELGKEFVLPRSGFPHGIDEIWYETKR